MTTTLLAQLPKALRVKEKLKAEILSGRYGAPGDEFVSVRRLSKDNGISHITAYRIMNLLKSEGVIALVDNRHVLCRAEGEKAKSTTSAETASQTIGLVVTNLENPFFTALSKQVEQVASRNGFKLLIASSNHEFAKEREILMMFTQLGVCGILSCPGTEPEVEDLYARQTTPLVFIARTFDNLKVDAVLAQQFSAGQLVARHLAGLQRKSFAYLGIKELRDDPRFLAYQAELVRLGHGLPAAHIVKSNAADFDSVIPALADMLQKIPKPTGVFCFHDLLALRVIRICHSLQLKIPQEVAVVGFDDLPVASEVTPSLTTVGYPLADMAEVAFDRLMKKVKGKQLRRGITHYLETSLIVRESTVAAAASGNVNGVRQESLLYQVA